MATEKAIRIVCDGFMCDEQTTFIGKHVTKQGTRDAMVRINGWVQIGRKDFCPQCAKGILGC